MARSDSETSHDETNGWIFTRAAHIWMDKEFRHQAGAHHTFGYGGMFHFKRVSLGLPDDPWTREET